MQSKKWSPEISVAYWINNASRTVIRLHESRLKPLGFTMGHVPILVALESGKEELTQKELAERAHVEQPTMAEMLKRMDRDGIIQKRASPADKRAMLVSLKRTHRDKVPAARKALWQGEADATKGFSEAEKAQLIALLKRVVRNIAGDEWGGPALAD